MKKMDIRTKFTQKALKDSLIECMKATPIRDIPIKAICAGAEVSRSTFYNYYNDQYDLLREIEEQTFIETDKIIQPYIKIAPKSRNRAVINLLHDILQYIADNSNSIQVLLSENGNSAFQKKYFRNGIEVVRKITEGISIKAQEERAARYGFVFVVAGMLALVQEWLKNGMDTPVPELARTITRLMREI
ncbi:MAG: TetR/AcrR family transcriptional regulator [Spirochaetaceae bacterium]|nr:TetR/AcrR family transcriptional regulator [Spirochaetaceae bacterium]